MKNCHKLFAALAAGVVALFCWAGAFGSGVALAGTPAANSWNTAPSLSTNVFTQGASVTAVAGKPTYGSATANYTAAQLKNLAPGCYTYRSTVAGTASYAGLTNEIDFVVMKATFDLAHTIVCYGDSLTAGSMSDDITVDNRPNYFDGRIAGNIRTMAGGLDYPYYLAGFLPSNYNVIAQAKGGQYSDQIVAWQGALPMVTRRTVTLPAGGAGMACPTNLLFTSENPYGVEGGFHADVIKYGVQYWRGAQMMDLPCVETYPTPSGIYSSMSGWFGDKHVRIYGTERSYSRTDKVKPGMYSPDQMWARIGDSAAAPVTIPAGSTFVPDGAKLYKDAITVFLAGANDGTNNIDTAISLVERAVASIPSGRYVVMSPQEDWLVTEAGVAKYAQKFGNHYIDLYQEFSTNGLKRAVEIDVMTQAQADAAPTWNCTNGLMSSDGIHPNSRGYAVIASVLKDKLVELGYVTEPPPPVPHTHVWGAWMTNPAPTCVTTGKRTRSCTASGCTTPVATQTETVAALGHDFGAWYTNVVPRVGVAGELRRYCRRTGCGHYEMQTLPPLPTPETDTPVTFGHIQLAGSANSSGVTFNTGYRPNCATTRVEMKFQMTDVTKQSSGLFAASPATAVLEGEAAGDPSDLSYGAVYYNNKNGRTPYVGVYNGITSGSCFDGFNDTASFHVLSYVGNVLSLDGASSNLSYVATNACASGPLVIGASTYGNGYGNFAKMCLAYFRIYEQDLYEGELLKHEYVAVTNAAGQATLFDKVTKQWLTPRFAGDGTATVGGGAVDPTVTPEEPAPFDSFDAAHTIIFYGDSSVWGESAGYPADVTPAHDNTELSAEELARPNYFGGRLAGYTDMVRRSMPFYLSGMVTNFNVINQARSGMCTDFITGIYGSTPGCAAYDITLSKTSGVWTDAPSAIHFSDTSYRFAPLGYKYYSYLHRAKPEPAKTNNWIGVGTPCLPLWAKPAPDGKGTLTGTLGGVPVRIDASYNYLMRITRLSSAASDTVIPKGAAFVSDNQRLYKDAIHVLEYGGNDGDLEDTIKYLTEKIVALGNSRYVFITGNWMGLQSGETADQLTPTAGEQAFENLVGADRCLNLRLAMLTNGVAIAHQLGYSWVTHIGTGEGGLKVDGGAHFNYAGNHVYAYLWKEKLRQLGWLGDQPETDTPVTFGHIQLAGSVSSSGVTFNTGYRPNCATTRVEMKFQMTDVTSQSSGLFIASPATAVLESEAAGEPSDLFYGSVYYYNKGGRIPWLGVNNGITSGSCFDGFNDTASFHVLSYVGNVLSLDGASSNLSYVATNACASGPLVIGASTYGNGYGNFAKMCLAYFRIYEQDPYEGELLRHEYVAVTNAAGQATLFDKVTKQWLTPRFAGDGTATVGGGAVDPTPVVPPEIEPSMERYDAAHTIIFYGESIIWGENAGCDPNVGPTVSDKIQVTAEELARPNYMGGRLTPSYPGDVKRSIPFYMSGLVSTNYNCINQGRSGMCTDFITGIYGSMPCVSDYAVTLDATAGKYVSFPNGLVYNAPDYLYNPDGFKLYSYQHRSPPKPQSEWDNWRGQGTPCYPLWESMTEDRGSICGTLGGVRVRITSSYNTTMTITRLTPSGTATVIPQGAAFVPDHQNYYRDAIHVIECGGNDGYPSRTNTYLKLLQRVTALNNPRYLITVPSYSEPNRDFGQTAMTAGEQEMVALFGTERTICLRYLMANRGVAIAQQLGYKQVTSFIATDGTGLMADSVHFNYAGNHVAAYLYKEKLVQLGWLKDEPDPPTPPVDPTKYGPKDTAAVTYTWKDGVNGPWEYTTNWTAGTGATYGIPNAAVATAVFPATLPAGTEVVVTNKLDVKRIDFQNTAALTLTLDNAKFTVPAGTSNYDGLIEFGKTGSATMKFRGASPRIETNSEDSKGRLIFGNETVTSYQTTLDFVLPATAWTEATAPLRSPKRNSPIRFYPNVRFRFDAQAIPVLSAGTAVTNVLAYAQDGTRVANDAATLDTAVFDNLPAETTGKLAQIGLTLSCVISRAAEPSPGPEPEPEPGAWTPPFPVDHTIICFGDSLTYGANASPLTIPTTPNYFDGRLNGLKHLDNYPYRLANLVPTNYNVIAQAKSGKMTDAIISWTGGVPMISSRPQDIPPEAESYVPFKTNLLYYGTYGGYQWEKSGQDQYYGCLIPDLPLIDPIDPSKTTGSDNIVYADTLGGWMKNVHLRISGNHPCDHEVARTEAGAAMTIPAGTRFFPESRIRYKDAIYVIFAGTNDKAPRYQTVLEQIDSCVTNLPSGRCVVISSHLDSAVVLSGETAQPAADTTVEAAFGAHYGNRVLKLRHLLNTNGLDRAVALGLMSAEERAASKGWHTDNSKGGLMADGDPTHFSSRGCAVLASYVNDKLHELGYVTGSRDPQPVPPVDPTKYGQKDTTAVTYTWKDGVNGPWEYTTNWTAGAGATYGIPNAAVATAVFPSTLPAGTAVLVTNKLDVKRIDFQNTAALTLTLSNAQITVAAGTKTYDGLIEFGKTGPATLRFRGETPMIKGLSGYSTGRIIFGSSDAVSYQTTLDIALPSVARSKSEALILCPNKDSPVRFHPNVRFVIDAANVQQPGAGQSVTNVLASNPDPKDGGIRIEDAATLSDVVFCNMPSGTVGELVVVDTELCCVLTRSATPYPTVDGKEVEPTKVFETAGVTKPISYPTAPTLTGTAAVDQRIAYGGVTTDVPVYYTATLSGTTVSLAWNDRAKPMVADGEATKAFVIEDGQVKIHLENTWPKLWYALSTANALPGTWTTGTPEQGKADFEVPQPSSSAQFYRIVVQDVAPAEPK